MYTQCRYYNTTPLFACYSCPYFLETCSYVVSQDGYALGSECGQFYLCQFCNDDCIYRYCINL
jgi:hypothetical protein